MPPPEVSHDLQRGRHACFAYRILQGLTELHMGIELDAMGCSLHGCPQAATQPHHSSGLVRSRTPRAEGDSDSVSVHR